MQLLAAGRVYQTSHRPINPAASAFIFRQPTVIKGRTKGFTDGEKEAELTAMFCQLLVTESQEERNLAHMPGPFAVPLARSFNQWFSILTTPHLEHFWLDRRDGGTGPASTCSSATRAILFTTTKTLSFPLGIAFSSTARCRAPNSFVASIESPRPRTRMSRTRATNPGSLRPRRATASYYSGYRRHCLSMRSTK